MERVYDHVIIDTGGNWGRGKTDAEAIKNMPLNPAKGAKAIRMPCAADARIDENGYGSGGKPGASWEHGQIGGTKAAPTFIPKA